MFGINIIAILIIKLISEGFMLNIFNGLKSISIDLIIRVVPKEYLKIKVILQTMINLYVINKAVNESSNNKLITLVIIIK